MNPIFKALFNQDEKANTIVMCKLIKGKYDPQEILELIKSIPNEAYHTITVEKKKLNLKSTTLYNLCSEILETNNEKFIQSFFEIKKPYPAQMNDFIKSLNEYNVFVDLCEHNMTNSIKALKTYHLLSQILQSNALAPIQKQKILEKAYQYSSDEILDSILEHLKEEDEIKKAKLSLLRGNPKYIDRIKHVFYEPIERHNSISFNLNLASLVDKSTPHPIYLSTILMLNDELHSYEKLMSYLPKETQSEQNKSNIHYLNSHKNSYVMNHLMSEEEINEKLSFIEKFDLENKIKNSNIKTTKLKI